MTKKSVLGIGGKNPDRSIPSVCACVRAYVRACVRAAAAWSTLRTCSTAYLCIKTRCYFVLPVCDFTVLCVKTLFNTVKPDLWNNRQNFFFNKTVYWTFSQNIGMCLLMNIIFDASGFYGSYSLISWEYGGKTAQFYSDSNWAKIWIWCRCCFLWWYSDACDVNKWDLYNSRADTDRRSLLGWKNIAYSSTWRRPSFLSFVQLRSNTVTQNW